MADYWKLKIQKYKDSTGNWQTTLTGGYLTIEGKVSPMTKYREPDYILDTNGNPTTEKVNSGYWKVTAELTNLINPFTNPITNTEVKETKIEAAYEGEEWGKMVDYQNYSLYLARSVAEVIERRYKSLFGVEIKLTTKFEKGEEVNTTTPIVGSPSTTPIAGSPSTTTTVSGQTASGQTASGQTASGQTASAADTGLYGEFTFNVETEFLFNGNVEFGSLEIIGKGVIKEEKEDIPVEEVIDEEVIDEEYAETDFKGDEEVAFEVFFKDSQSTEGAVEDVYIPPADNNSTATEQATGSLVFDGKKFLQPKVSQRYPTNYVLYIDSTKVPKPKLTKKGLIKTKLAVEGGLTGDKKDSAAKSGYCPTERDGKKYHTNKGITYAVWKGTFGTGNDKRFLDMNLADWTKIFDTSYWNKNATSKYDAVNCLLTSFAWGGNKPKTLKAALTLLNVSNIDDVSVEKAVAALISARAQFFVNISQPDNKNNRFRTGWINAVNAFVTETYFS